MSSPSRKRRHHFLAAPFVATVVVGSFGCESNPPPEQPHMNPGPPQEAPSASASAATPADTAIGVAATPSATASATSAPIATASPSPSASADSLPDAPKTGGNVITQADGTCLFVYDRQMMHCPPGASCNPGPPQKPLKVKCGSGAAPKKP